jgi:GNAT superfamily N-acetyltransferase
MNELAIRPMNPADVVAAAAVMDSGGWRGRTPFLEWGLANPAIEQVVGELDGRIVSIGQGAINPAPHGSVGWVGSIFTDPTLRGRGYGRAITEEVCRRLEGAGCRTLALIASDLGRPIYTAMGFRIDAWYQIWEADTTAEEPRPPEATRLRPMTPGDVDRVGELDRRATGEDRRALLRELTENAWLLEDGDGCEVLGYLAQVHPENGTIVAPDPADAAFLLNLLRKRAHGRGSLARAALVRPPDGETDPRARRMLAEAGWRPAFETPRMLRGPSIDWDPTLIWGVLSFAFG